ncbi:MAG: hypothetical protein Q4C65_13070 [Eubacteriales bacterium]|nr:hypothetical protein [Eubacteriales bacterium]
MNFQGSAHLNGVGSLSNLIVKDEHKVIPECVKPLIKDSFYTDSNE